MSDVPVELSIRRFFEAPKFLLSGERSRRCMRRYERFQPASTGTLHETLTLCFTTVAVSSGAGEAAAALVTETR